MPKRFAVLLTLILAVPLAGCANYLVNRQQDLIDVAHVDLTRVSTGAVAYAGPFMLGVNYVTDAAEAGGPADVLQIGLLGARLTKNSGSAAGLIWPVMWWNEEQDFIDKRPKRSPSILSAGVSLGAILGVRVHADLLEAVDLALGLVCIDVMGDDSAGKDEPPDKPEQPKPDELGKL